MTIDEQTLFAWLDGELEGAEADRVAAAVAADPSLAEQAAAHRAMQAKLRAAFDPLMKAPMPDSIAAPVVDLAAARERRAKNFGGVPQWAAMAATLVIGLGLGAAVSQRSDDAPVAVEAGHMVASASLRDALDTQLASAPKQGEGPRVGLTFRTADGALCRSFSGASGASGLACRSNGQWQLRGLFGGAPGASTDYRMAAGEDPRLASLIDDSIAGEPFDAAAERAAKERGWR